MIQRYPELPVQHLEPRMDTHKKDDVVSVTLTFSEAIYTTGVMNVVFTMDGD